MERHPIENIMSTTMENIRDMVDVNTVIGDPITTQDGSTVIPVSRVCFGFVAGGGEYRITKASKPLTEAENEHLPFAGGTGAGVTIHPVGFLVEGKDSVRLLPTQAYAPVDRAIELIPQLICEIKKMIKPQQRAEVQIPQD